MTRPLYFWNGTSFEQVGPTVPQSPIAYQTSAPTGPATGDLWIDSDGDVDTYNRQLTRFYFVATAGQTSVSGADANNLTLAYTPGSEMVHVNGALLVRGVDYTATNGTSITGLSALALNDVVEVFAYTAFTVANAYTKSETDGVAAAAPGLRMIVPTSVAVGSGTGSVDAIGNVTFSSASSISVNGCFSSTYDNYKIMFNVTSTSANNYPILRLRASGTDNSSSNYNYSVIERNTTNTTVSGYAGSNSTSFQLGYCLTGGSSNSIEIFSPFITDYCSYYEIGTTKVSTASSANYTDLKAGGMSVTTSYDGFSIITGSGTITGTIRIYGYKD